MPFGPWELIIIGIIVLIIFGTGKLGQLGGAVGKSIREFRTESKVGDEEAKSKRELEGGETEL